METFVKNADQFDPDRFLRKQGDDGDHLREVFMPFSIGNRNCIGQPMAMAEKKSVVAQVVRRYRLAVPTGTVRPVSFFMPNLKPHRIDLQVLRR